MLLSARSCIGHGCTSVAVVSCDFGPLEDWLSNILELF
jgi:hypothetical protein